MKKADDYRELVVQILEAKPNKMFTEEQRSWVRFLRYSRSVPCAECGKRRRIHWTMLCSFIAKNMGQFVLTGETVRMPLTPVCSEHPLAVARKENDPVGQPDRPGLS